MPIFLIFFCEIGVFSFLIGAYFYSLGIGLITLAGTSITLYFLFQVFFNPRPFVWTSALLGGFTILLWATHLDHWLNTSFIAVFLGLITLVFFYYTNDYFFKKYHR